MRKRAITSVLVLLAVALSAGGVYTLFRSGEIPDIRAELSVSDALSVGSTEGFARAVKTRAFSFPDDDGPHPEYKIEWWYYTGNLDSTEGRHFGFQLTFFRIALAPEPAERESAWAASNVYTAHFALTDVEGNRLIHVAHGVVTSDRTASLAQRLHQLYEGLCAVLERYRPSSAAVEETFVNKNPKTTLALGQARGIAMLAPAQAGLEVSEYAANLIKKSVVGNGHADKRQVAAMVHRLLPGCLTTSSDAADALAVAICHAHHVQTRDRWAAGQAVAGR